jgi:2-C-methyl-D-erythritol 4-phosphate cytidylyltransferase
MGFGVVIAAAGRGKRMGSPEKKQFIELSGKPVLYHSVQLFSRLPDIQEIVVVTSADDMIKTRKLLQGLFPITVVPGGAERQQSVFLGLKALNHVEYVLIHDAARPFTSKELIKRIMEKTVETGSAIPAVPVKDTIKMVNEEKQVISTPPRQSLWAVQTPQAFRLSTILEAHQKAEADGFLGSDDAMLLERLGKPVHIVAGEYTNIKLTTVEDLRTADWIIKEKGR